MTQARPCGFFLPTTTSRLLSLFLIIRASLKASHDLNADVSPLPSMSLMCREAHVPIPIMASDQVAVH